jgi:hypothetical protein
MREEIMKIVMWSMIAVFAAICIVFAVDTTAVDTLIKQTVTVVAAVQGLKAGDVAWIVVLAAVIKLLISCMQLAPVAKFFDTPKMKAVKPYIAMILGVVGGIVNSKLTGMSLIASIIAGFTSGLGAVGVHEAVKTLSGKNV